MSTDVFIEQVELVESTLDKGQRTVDVVLIRPGWSSNGRYYPAEVLAAAAHLYENARAFANHLTREQMRRGDGRSVTDMTGRYYNIRVGEGGEIRATRKVYDNPAGNAVWPAIVDTIESGVPAIGLSHYAAGTVTHGRGPDGKEGAIVESIQAVNSVDDVVNPAAGGGFEALAADANGFVSDVLNALDYDEFIAARPEFVERLKKEWKAIRQTEAVAAAHEERDQAQMALVEAGERVQALTEQLTEQEAELARLRGELSRKGLEVELERAFREARLPAQWEKDIRTQLTEAAPEQWLSILERERRKAQAAGVNTRVTVTGAPRSTAQPIAESRGQRRNVPDMDVIDTPEKLLAWQLQHGD